MGWVDEKEQDSVQDRMYSPKFLALRGSSLFKFSAPPVSLDSASVRLPPTPSHHKTSEFEIDVAQLHRGIFSFDVYVLLWEKMLSCWKIKEAAHS